MGKKRLEAFSDGVLAIIITIMVLELKQPDGDKLNDLLTLWPTMLSYFVSFLFISVYWVNHHMLFQMTEKINSKILWCNLLWLFVMSFVPFATSWVGRYPQSFLPLCHYFVLMFMAGITFRLMYHLIQRENNQVPKMRVQSIISLCVYIVAAAVGGFCSLAAFVLVIVVTIWWIFSIRIRDKRQSNK